MMLWVIFALMSAAAILAVLWPLARKPRAVRAGSDVVVYQDQLEEIDRDRTAGLIGAAEAEAARIEVSRRLLAAADSHAPMPAQAPPLWHRRAAAIAALVVLSLLPIGLYAALGSPEIPGQPAFARAAVPPDRQTIVNLIGQVEQHLAQNPNDGAGWEVIAPVYIRLGRFDDAVAARRKSLALNGETAQRDSALGEALVAVPLLALAIPVEVAAPVAVLASITVALIVVVQDWRNIHVRSAVWLVVPTLFGIPLGLIVLKTVPEAVMKAILAAVIIAFAVWSLTPRAHFHLNNDRLAGFFGFAAGAKKGVAEHDQPVL